MLNRNVRPTTIDGVKRLAIEIRKKSGIQHSAALDRAAQAANCSNYRNARRVLPARAVMYARPYVLLTIYWRDEKKPQNIGRETLNISLSKPILHICDKLALKYARGFGDFRMVADDHFVCDTLAHTQVRARERLCTAERSLRFMEYTGLRPCRNHRKNYPDGSSKDSLPNNDHATRWIDPIIGQFILVDEPYKGVPDDLERTQWAIRHKWLISKTSWAGMYNPYKCDLYIATEDSSNYDLDALTKKINNMPPPLLEKNWSGESVLSWDMFVSPMADTPQDIRRARSQATVIPKASTTSLPCSYKPGSRTRRPVGALGIEGHIHAGRIIKAILWSGMLPDGVHIRLSSLRSTLEGWMSFEIKPGELEGSEFFDVYYHQPQETDPYNGRAKSRDGIVALLFELKGQLQATYQDCAPLRQQIRRIEMSATLINKMKTIDN
ncbi:DUF5623 domain-containing protein [Brytella acorum]|uniref:DUF5623 domain-containing protein n=1 Tax=Brytella acorum TaxID=2959299 RepID=A0AA35V9Y9_9PROT|nr:DUF5623 domain-containing protein [Brytella acorum]CAI9122220.1 DUF5623 domain-containing protein [Brytella acorum]